MHVRVALVKGRGWGDDGYYNAFGAVMQPLGLAVLAAAVRNHGHQVRLIDALARRLEIQDVAREIVEFGTDVVGVTMIASPYHPYGRELSRLVKGMRPDTVFVAGGHHASYVFPQILREGFDYVVSGEADEAFPELVDALEAGGPPSDVRGVAYLRDGTVRHSVRPQLASLDDAPVPAYDLLERDHYPMAVMGPKAHIASIETSRGCPYNCEFCSVTRMWGHQWRFKSVERIVEEMRRVKALGYDWIFFVDDIFIEWANLEHRMELFRRILEEGLDDLQWMCQLRADVTSLRPKAIEAGAQAGMRVAFLGLESGDERVLNTMRKGIRPSTSRHAVEVLSGSGVLVLGGFILGAPYEGREQIDETVRFAESLFDSGLDAAQFSVYTPLPGTRAFYDAIREGRLLTSDWSKFDVLTPVMRTGVRPFWLLAKDRVSNYSFYIRKWMHARRRGASQWQKPLLERAEAFYKRNLLRFVPPVILLPWELMRYPFRIRREKTIPEGVLRELLALEGFAPFETRPGILLETEPTATTPVLASVDVTAADGGGDAPGP